MKILFTVFLELKKSIFETEIKSDKLEFLILKSNFLKVLLDFSNPIIFGLVSFIFFVRDLEIFMNKS